MEKLPKKIITEIFETGIDGASSDGYLAPSVNLRYVSKQVGDDFYISIKDLKSVMVELSNKWQKEIDEYIENENNL